LKTNEKSNSKKNNHELSESKRLEKADRFFQQGNDEFNQKRFNSALKNYNSAISNNPNAREYYTNKSVALTEIGKIDEALETVDIALSMNSKCKQAKLAKANILNSLGLKLFSQAKYKEAIEKYDLALELDNSKEYLINKAAVYIELKNYQDAIKALDKALIIDKNYTPAKVEKAYALNCQANLFKNNSYVTKSNML
jgi:tetratricopeptide (TPR) repeat protein